MLLFYVFVRGIENFGLPIPLKYIFSFAHMFCKKKVKFCTTYHIEIFCRVHTNLSENNPAIVHPMNPESGTPPTIAQGLVGSGCFKKVTPWPRPTSPASRWSPGGRRTGHWTGWTACRGSRSWSTPGATASLAAKITCTFQVCQRFAGPADFTKTHDIGMHMWQQATTSPPPLGGPSGNSRGQ